MKQTAIITGDIVGSKNILPANRERLYNEIEIFLRELRKDKILKKFELYRGDSFQCEIREVGMALRTALIIKCFIKTFQQGFTKVSRSKRKSKRTIPKLTDIRLSVGIGNVDFIKGKLAVSDGEAFHYSGEGLEKIKNSDQHLYLQTNDESFNKEMHFIIILLDALIQKSYSGQAEVILYKLRGWIENEIADHLGITQSAVSQRSKSAFWHAIEMTVQNFENKFA